MAFEKSAMHTKIREDLEGMQDKRETVKASFFEKMFVKKASPKDLHVNPADEFTHADVGPNDAIMENYCQLARRNDSLGLPVFEEAIQVNKLKDGGYLILNGHHRWAGAFKACIPKVRISITDPLKKPEEESGGE
jgi:hypothetical protein